MGAKYNPQVKRTLRQTVTQECREGWEDARIFLYETSPNERAVVQALARRFKDTWTVVIIDGKQPTLEKARCRDFARAWKSAAGNLSAGDIRWTEGGCLESGASQSDESLCRDGDEQT